jgi:putative transposase
MQVLTYKYRILPSRDQHTALTAICESQRQLYNAALEERIAAWRQKDRATGKGISITCLDQFKALTQCRHDDPSMASLPPNLQRATLKRLDTAFAGFFSRVKRKATAGFPRFKGKGWFDSFGFLEFSGIKLDRGTRRITFSGLPGSLRLHLHRPLPDTKILGCTFRKDAKGWSVTFTVKVPVAEKKISNRRVGIDVGVTDLVAFSDGSPPIPNARPAQCAERAIRLTQRALARCKRGSKRRKKTKLRLARVHAKISNTRATYLHQVSAKLAREYDHIVLEDLRIQNMTRSASRTIAAPGTNVAAKSGLNRAILDAAWGKLKFNLIYKAARAGGEIETVDPKGSSQTCSDCGHVAKENRRRKVFRCVACGHAEDADTNASKIVERRSKHRAVVGPAVNKVVHQNELRPRNITLENAK